MLDTLYSNIGAKIKNWAKWMFILEAFSAFAGGIILMADEEFLYGLLCMIVGPIVAFVSTWLLYAFGEIAEDIGLLRQKYVGEKVIEQQKRETLATYQTSRTPTAKELRHEKIRNMWADWSEEDSFIGQCDICGAENQFLAYAEYQEGDSIQRKNLCFDCFSQRDCKPVTRK